MDSDVCPMSNSTKEKFNIWKNCDAFISHILSLNVSWGKSISHAGSLIWNSKSTKKKINAREKGKSTNRLKTRKMNKVWWKCADKDDNKKYPSVAYKPICACTNIHQTIIWMVFAACMFGYMLGIRIFGFLTSDTDIILCEQIRTDTFTYICTPFIHLFRQWLISCSYSYCPFDYNNKYCIFPIQFFPFPPFLAGLLLFDVRCQCFYTFLLLFALFILQLVQLTWFFVVVFGHPLIFRSIKWKKSLSLFRQPKNFISISCCVQFCSQLILVFFFPFLCYYVTHFSNCY